ADDPGARVGCTDAAYDRVELPVCSTGMAKGDQSAECNALARSCGQRCPEAGRASIAQRPRLRRGPAGIVVVELEQRHHRIEPEHDLHRFALGLLALGAPGGAAEILRPEL